MICNQKTGIAIRCHGKASQQSKRTRISGQKDNFQGPCARSKWVIPFIKQLAVLQAMSGIN